MRMFCGFGVHYVTRSQPWAVPFGAELWKSVFRSPLPLPAANCFPFRDRVFFLPSGISIHLRKFDSYSLIAPTAGDPYTSQRTGCACSEYHRFWPHSRPRHDAHRVASERVANAAVSAVDVVYPFVFGRRWPCTWRSYGQDTRRRCCLGRPNCTSRSTTFV